VWRLVGEMQGGGGSGFVLSYFHCVAGLTGIWSLLTRSKDILGVLSNRNGGSKRSHVAGSSCFTSRRYTAMLCFLCLTLCALRKCI